MGFNSQVLRPVFTEMRPCTREYKVQEFVYLARQVVNTISVRTIYSEISRRDYFVILLLLYFFYVNSAK